MLIKGERKKDYVYIDHYYLFRFCQLVHVTRASIDRMKMPPVSNQLAAFFTVTTDPPLFYKPFLTLVPA